MAFLTGQAHEIAGIFAELKRAVYVTQDWNKYWMLVFVAITVSESMSAIGYQIYNHAHWGSYSADANARQRSVFGRSRRH
jgi:hypothetical protein